MMISSCEKSFFKRLVDNDEILYSSGGYLRAVRPLKTTNIKENLDWHIEADFGLNMDLNGGHVNNVSRYHYHNIPTDYFNNDLNYSMYIKKFIFDKPNLYLNKNDYTNEEIILLGEKKI